MRSIARIVTLIGAMTGAVATCGGQAVVLGGHPESDQSDAGVSDARLGDSEPADSSTDATKDAGIDVSADAPADADAAATPLSGTYSGYIESFQFPDGSDTVIMKLAFAGDGTVTGTVRFGSAPLLAPPTDPNVGYPPNLTSTGPAGLLEGFAFTIIGGTYAAPRVQLSLYNNELWKQWCELQAVIYEVDNGDPTSDAGPCGKFFGYGCLPNGGTMSSASGCSVGSCTTPPSSISVDCGKLVLCMGGGRICSCTATSCTVPLPPTGTTSFDMQLTSRALNGTVTGLDTQLHNVHLTRSP